MLRRHLDLLVHACTCRKQECVPNCIKMRELLRHVHECPIKSQGGCKKCRRVWLLLQYHAKSCKTKDCQVPKCGQIREALRYAIKQASKRAGAGVSMVDSIAFLFFRGLLTLTPSPRPPTTTPHHTNSMRQLQQLAMEDRRRQAQNSTIGYRVQPKPKEEEEEG